MPELIALANIHRDYVDLLSERVGIDDSSATTRSPRSSGRSQIRAPNPQLAARVADDLFYEPGTATARCVAEIYDAIGLASTVPDGAIGKPGGENRDQPSQSAIPQVCPPSA